jgi:uncharacterized protein
LGLLTISSTKFEQILIMSPPIAPTWNPEPDHLRAIEWAIASAPMLDIREGTLDAQWPDARWFLNLWEGFPERDRLAQLLGERSWKAATIGKYFEELVGAFFDLHPDWRIIGQHVVLQQGTRTLGECDLIVEDLIEKRIYHIELACKYYLSARASSHWSHWLGRNTADSLEIKMNTLERQIHLLDTSEGKAWREEQALDKVTKLVWLKGYSFVHRTSIMKPTLPRWHHRQGAVGWWLSIDEWTCFENAPRQWLLLPKKWWLVFPMIAFTEVEEQLMDDAALLVAIRHLFKNTHHRGWLIAQIGNREDQAVELTRGMVVDARWPGKGLSY